MAPMIATQKAQISMIMSVMVDWLITFEYERSRILRLGVLR